MLSGLRFALEPVPAVHRIGVLPMLGSFQLKIPALHEIRPEKQGAVIVFIKSACVVHIRSLSCNRPALIRGDRSLGRGKAGSPWVVGDCDCLSGDRFEVIENFHKFWPVEEAIGK